MASYEEPVTFTRAGRSITLPAAFDPSEFKLFLDEGSDVQAGDLATLRGYSRLVVDPPQVWTDGGVVAQLEPDPVWLPDLCTLEKLTGTTSWDPVANTETPDWATVATEVPCRVEAVQSKSSEVLIGQQATEVQPYTITLPATVTDVRRGYRLTVTTSRNPLLLTRKLIITRIPAESLSEQLTVLAKEEQP